VIRKKSLGLVLLSLASAAIVNAAPRLALSQTALSLSVAAGANGPSQSVDAANVGDGSLNLQASSSVTWLTASLGTPHTCALAAVCTPIQISVQSSTLAKGTFTGIITVSDPNAVDAPQFITVTVQVGGTVPDKLEFFVPPGGTASSTFTTASPVTTSKTGGSWLSIAVDGIGTFRFNVPYRVTVDSTGLAVGDSNGSITLSGSSLASDNKTFPVVLHVTTQPILQTNFPSVQFRATQGSTAKQSTTVPVSNGGQGTLTISGVTAAAAASGTWLSAATATDGVGVAITADPTGLAANSYTGTVTVASNAANSSVIIPVQLVVAAQTAPVAFAGGAVNNGTFAPGESLAQGDIAAIFGDQFTLGTPQFAATVPLTTDLAATRVFVNNIAAPLYYSSSGQIDFEVPLEVPVGPATVRVERGGQRGNSIFVNIAPSVPRFILLNGGPYAIITTPDNVLTGIPTHPVKTGDVIVIYALGLGPTTPSVPTGAPAPTTEPLARVSGVQVCFRPGTPVALDMCSDPAFAGLAPGFVGLYQVNATVPTLTDATGRLTLVVNGIASTSVNLANQ
jgi:uncharacterized protein (TIGR03437 family)